MGNDIIKGGAMSGIKKQEITKGIILLTQCIEEVEGGSGRWLPGRGGQSRGWAVFNWIATRYNIPQGLQSDILNGFLRAKP